MQIRFLAIVLPGILVWPALGADDWPQFRGPTGQGLSSAENLPVAWSENENIAWKTPIPGRGWSSPVVSGEDVWVTTALETAAEPGEKEQRLAGKRHQESLDVAKSVLFCVLCIDRATGEVKRKVELFQVDRPQPIHRLNGYTSPTPVVESGYLWCDFGTFGTVCLDAATAKILWRRELPIDHEVGPGSSPIIRGDLLILTRDGCDRQYIAGLDKRTGKTVWKTGRPPIDLNDEFKKAFSTPLVCETSSGAQMIVPGAQWVVSYDPATGEPIWWADYVKGYSLVPRPVFGDGVVYICTTSPGHQLWAIRTNGRGDVTNTHVKWIVKRQVPNKVSPLLVGTDLYMVTDTGVVTCLDTRTGKARWQKRLEGNFSASPMATPTHLYFFGEDGQTTVFDPADPARPVAENRLPGKVVATPAVAGETLLLRTETHLWAIRRGAGSPRVETEGK
jgi:outer membrane protein assembly factor BamB